MGLDMYLSGVDERGESEELGYWRKHPNLHGFIVDTFASGVDECQPIELGLTELQVTLAAVIADELRRKTGFFFGSSYPEHREISIRVLTHAIRWLLEAPGRKAVYQASW